MVPIGIFHEIPSHFQRLFKGRRKAEGAWNTVDTASKGEHTVMRHSTRVACVAIAITSLAAACGSDSKTGDSAATTTAAPAAGSDTTAAGATDTTAASGAPASLLDGAIKCEQQYAGKEVHIFSPVRDSENDHPIADFVSGYDPLVACTGVKIVFEGTDQFETEIKVRIEGGNAPDVIDFPQPGLLASLARKNELTPLTDPLIASVKKDFIKGFDTYSTVDGTVYGIPSRANVKSLVWYSPADFAAKGYKIPTTLEELKALSDQIVADGGTPWCAGIESGVATGWPATDWFEDFMLRINGEKVYDQWVNHEIPFNDPKVAAVADAVASYLKNPDYIGGANAVKAIATTKFQEGGLPILNHDGSCYMHRQASFYSTLWPEGTKVGDDGDISFFYLPSPAGGPKYVLGAGDIYAAGNAKPETMDTLLYTSSNEYALHLLNTRHELSSRLDIDTSKIEDPFTRSLAELLAGAEVFRFDGSDLMPGAVGAGTFWTEVTAWIVGSEDTQTMLDNIEASWPAS